MTYHSLQAQRHFEVEVNASFDGVGTITNTSDAGFAGLYFHQGTINRGYVGYIGNGDWIDTSTFQLGSFIQDIAILHDAKSLMRLGNSGIEINSFENQHTFFNDTSQTESIEMYNGRFYNHRSFSQPQNFSVAFGSVDPSSDGDFIIASDSRTAGGDEGGIFLSDETAAIFNSGDEGAFLRIINEDAWNNDGDPYDDGATVVFIDESGMWQTSDQNLKSNIKKVSDSLKKLSKISGYSYTFNPSPEEKSKNKALTPVLGLLAQELEKAIPEAVQKSAGGDYHVNYAMITPVLIEGIKELSSDNQRLHDQNKDLVERLESLEKLVHQLIEE